MNETNFQRNTPQRRVILEEIQKATSHPTAAELYERVRRRLPKISLGTVYRNLDLLAEMGKIQKLDVVGGEARFDGNLAAHHHVRCVRCGRVDDVYGLPTGTLIDGRSEAAGYEILGHRLELVGICPQCEGSPEKEPTGPARQQGKGSQSCKRPGQP